MIKQRGVEILVVKIQVWSLH